MRNWLCLSALVAAIFAIAPVQANEMSCSGRDLVALMQQDNPAQYKKLMRDAASVKHGDGLLFRMEKKGKPDIHVFGTMHVEDPRLKQFPKALEDVLADAEVIATELKEDDLTNPVTMLKIAAMGANPKADTLAGYAEGPRALITKALLTRGITEGAAERMDAAFLLLSLALPPCAIETDPEKVFSKEIIDQKVARIAKSHGARNIGLETAVEQMNAIKNISVAAKHTLLKATAEGDALATDMFVTSKTLYVERKPGLLLALSRLLLSQDPAIQGAYSEFMERLLDRRNTGMVSKVLELGAKHKTVVAVGALHLVGEQGIIAMLERQGYKAKKLW